MEFFVRNTQIEVTKEAENTCKTLEQTDNKLRLVCSCTGKKITETGIKIVELLFVPNPSPA